ncbi:IS701 family transposase, partial [Methylobacterium sp. E-066]|nr:IS701 family transposase [Methylobacterium sp. E-066]
MMAYAFLQSRRLAAAGRKKKNRLPAAPAIDAGDPPSHPGSPQSATTAAMPAL